MRTLNSADDKENNGIKTENKITKERVCEDVYLVDKSNNVTERNLLSNSITAKIKQGIPSDIAIRTNIMNKLRRENLKDHLHLSNLNRQYAAELQMETNRLDQEGSKVLKRQEQVRKQSEWQRKSQDKIRSQIRRTSIKVENGQPLPHIKQSSIQSTVITKSGGGDSNIGHSVVYHHAPDMVLKERSKSMINDFPRVPVDKDDPTYVKMFKNNGIFQPQNKYPNKSRSGSGILKTSSLPEYQILTLSLNDNDSTTGSEKSSKRKKGLRVTWSGVDREHNITSRHEDEMSSPTDSQKSIDGASSPTAPSLKSASSMQSDTYIFQKVSPRTGRSKIESIGIQWKLPASQKPKEKTEPRSRSAHAGKLSHNLIPCATAMNKEGTSINKTKWFVPNVHSLTTYEMYKAWLEKLEKLKYPAETKKVQISPTFHSHTQSIGYPVPGNVTMVTEPLDMVL